MKERWEKRKERDGEIMMQGMIMPPHFRTLCDCVNNLLRLTHPGTAPKTALFSWWASLF